MDNKEIAKIREKLLEELNPLITPKQENDLELNTEILKNMLKEYYPKDTEIDVELTDDYEIQVHCKIPMSYRQITIEDEELK